MSHRTVRIAIIASMVGAMTLGVPGQLHAAPRIPSTLSTAITLSHSIEPGTARDLSATLPWRANMAGVTFVSPSKSASGVALTLRARALDGTWSAPQRLDAGEDGDGPDGDEAKHVTPWVSTAPVFVGTVDRITVHVDVEPSARAIHDVRLVLLNTEGDAKPRSVLATVFGGIRTFLTMTPTRADAIPSQPTIISRAQWGADESWRNEPPDYAPDVAAVFVHHTDTTNSYTKSQSAGIIRGIYHYHVFTRGFRDIAYNFLIDKYGQIFEGRYGGMTRPVVGAHTLGFNYRTTGVAALGTFTSTAPTSAMIGAYQRLLAWKMDVHYIPPVGTVLLKAAKSEKYTAGQWVRFNRISAHRNANFTACPGTKLYAKMDTIRRGADALGQPKMYLPSQTGNLVRRDGDSKNEYVTFRASFSRSVAYTVTVANSAGVTVRTFTGTGTSVNAAFGGVNNAGTPVPTGYYRWTITARDTGGHTVRPYGSALIVVTTHPDGTRLNDGARYALASSQRFDEADPVAFPSIFGSLPSIATGPGERARYVPSALAMQPRDAALIEDDGTGDRYIWSGGVLRKFATHPDDTFGELGYDTGAVLAAPSDYVSSLPHGPDISDVTEHPVGTAVRDPATGAVSIIDAGSRHPISALALASRYRANEVVAATTGDLSLPLDAATVQVRDGTVVAATDGGLPWLIDGGQKRRFYSSLLFSGMGYTTTMLLKGSSADVNAIPTGSRFG